MAAKYCTLEDQHHKEKGITLFIFSVRFTAMVRLSSFLLCECISEKLYNRYAVLFSY